MFGEKHDPEFLKHLFDETEILRKPVAGIIAGYHILPYILVGPQEDQPTRAVEIRGKIKVSPRLVLAPGRAGQTYGELFQDEGLMDEFYKTPDWMEKLQPVLIAHEWSNKGLNGTPKVQP